jgi:hypothetical protein
MTDINVTTAKERELADAIEADDLLCRLKAEHKPFSRELQWQRCRRLK